MRFPLLLLPHAWRLAALPDAGPGIVPVPSDAETMRRAATGDQAAWQELFDRWKKPLLAFFYRSLGSWAAAEELTLEVFVRLHRAAPRYESRAPFAAYLFSIARHLLLNEQRRRRRKPVDLLPPGELDYLEAPDADDAIRLRDLEEDFLRALHELPEAQRTVLLLVHQQNMDPAEAAGVLGVTANALRVQLHRARERLKEIIARPP